jgi:Ca2+-binding RTX toxin-like protein
MGRGSGGSANGRGSSDYGLSYDFELFELQADGTPTSFTGAIENFRGSFLEGPAIKNLGNDQRFAFFLDNPPNGNNVSTVNFPTQTTNLAASVGQSSITYKIAPTTYQYTDNSNNTKSGKVEIDFFLNDDDSGEAGFQADVKKQSGVETITVDTSQATSIKYIIDNGLFSSVDSLSVTGINGEGNSYTTFLASDQSGTFTPINPPTNPTVPSLNGDDVLTGDNGDNTLNGGDGNNVLRGLDGNDVLTAGAGLDNLDGGNGDDRLSSGGGSDTLTGGAGADNIDGGDGNDTIDGGSENDVILGGGGDDLINGGNGNDILNGGAGQDVLVGDGGADIFAINTLGGADVIRDFNYGEDKLGLSDGITYDDLIITQGNGAAIISYQDQAIASISGGTPGQINASLFTTI